jgi:hypothetical protein
MSAEAFLGLDFFALFVSRQKEQKLYTVRIPMKVPVSHQRANKLML